MVLYPAWHRYQGGFRGPSSFFEREVMFVELEIVVLILWTNRLDMTDREYE